jgi:hypothetical protein
MINIKKFQLPFIPCSLLHSFAQRGNKIFRLVSEKPLQHVYLEVLLVDLLFLAKFEKHLNSPRLLSF